MVAASALPPVYDWAAHHGRPIPGDRLAEQFFQHAQAIRDLQEAVGRLTDLSGHIAPGLVLDGSLDSGLIKRMAREIEAAGHAVLARIEAIGPEVKLTRTIQAAADAAQTAHDMSVRLLRIEEYAQTAAERNSRVESLLAISMPAIERAHVAVGNALRDSKDAEANAQKYAELAGAWAEYLPGPIPPEVLAIMGITGDHWSARWWAKESQNAAGAYPGLYLGPWETAPTPGQANPNPYGPDVPDPITEGAIYFNASDNGTYVWNGTSWQALAGGGAGEPAITPGTTDQYWRGDKTWQRAGTVIGRDVTISTSDPSGGVDGDLWFKVV